jgi:hypothetical protein
MKTVTANQVNNDFEKFPNYDNEKQESMKNYYKLR